MTIHWKRRLIPKWRISSDNPVVFGNDTRAVSHPKFLKDEDSRQAFERALSDFQRMPSLGVAADALRFGIENRYIEDLRPIAEYLINSAGNHLPSGIYQKARLIVSKSSAPLTDEPRNIEIDSFEVLQSMQRQQIHDLKASVRSYPRNALAWMDLARLKSSIGDNEAAKRHVIVALSLAPNNRFILRSAARFYVHIDESEQALKLIRNSPRTQQDPWLLASEIAISSIVGRSSRMLRKAREILESRRFAAADTAELAGAIAVEELTQGVSRKNARRFYLKSLIAPNDNALAQVLWAAQDLDLGDSIPSQWLDDPASAEAALYRAMDRGDIELGLRKACLWHLDEPFASRPMTAASFIATIKGDFESATHFAQTGLIGEPRNENLLNNLAFSLLCEGQIELATEAILRAFREQGSVRDGQTIANFGFLAYLCGETELGVRAYAETIKIFEKKGKGDEVAMAKIFHAFAAKGVSDLEYIPLKKQAIELAKKTKSAFVKQAAISMLGIGPNDIGLPPIKLESAEARKWLHDQNRNILYLKNFR